MTAEVVSIVPTRCTFSDAVGRVVLEALAEHIDARPLQVNELEALCGVLDVPVSEVVGRASVGANVRQSRSGPNVSGGGRVTTWQSK